MTVHALEEMAEDDLDIFDIEEAVLNGRVVRTGSRHYSAEILHAVHDVATGAKPFDRLEQIPVSHLPG